MRNIILIGFMGSGKSSIGKYISRTLKCSLVDSDSYIESKYSQTISSIFSQKGEEYFRQLETDTILELLSNNYHGIVAVGGGLPMKEENRDLLHQLGYVVYLRATVDSLEKRLTGDTKRPLLQGGNLREKIESLFEKRESTYVEISDLIVDTDDKSFKKIFEEIQEGVKESENTCY